MRLQPLLSLPLLLVGISSICFAQSPTATVIANFNEADGSVPSSNLIQTPIGGFVGISITPASGGVDGGMVFELFKNGTIVPLYKFASDGSQCAGVGQNGIVQASDGNFYGVCSTGGQYGQGTVFRVTRAGKFTLLHSFKGSDGSNPAGALIEGFDGNLYGVTTMGGSAGVGTLFKIGTGGFTSLYQFSASSGPSFPLPGLTLGPDGTIYGIYAIYASSGFLSAGGLVTISQSGAINFPSYFLAEPLTSPPVLKANGYLYAFCQPTLGLGNTTVTVEAANPNSEYASIVQNLPSYNGSDFINFGGGAIEADGQFFVNAVSIIQDPTEPYFEVEADPGTSSASLFNLQPYGSAPNLMPLQGADGQIYVANSAGGSAGYGSVVALDYSLAPPSPSILGFSPATGGKDTVVTIWGSSFVGAESVTLNGAPMPFATVASGFIKFLVTGSATTGTIEVKTAAGVATSAGTFTVE